MRSYPLNSCTDTQRILHNRYKSQPHYKLFAYTGLMRCGECGSGITAESKTKERRDGTTGQYTYYRCTKNRNRDCTQKTLREEGLEEQVLVKLEGFHMRRSTWHVLNFNDLTICSL